MPAPPASTGAARRPEPLTLQEIARHRAAHKQAAPETPVRFRFWLRAVSPAGLILGALFFLAALTPSLMPREAVALGLLAGLSAAIGYEIGNLVAGLWRLLALPERRRAGPGIALGLAVAAAVVAAALVQADGWQNATRAAVGLGPIEESYLLRMAGLAAAVAIASWAVFRLLGVLGRRLGRGLGRLLPGHSGAVLATLAVAYLVWAATDGVLLHRALIAADASFEAADLREDPEVPRPQDPARTGGPGSLVAWDEMGRWGRAFVATAPTAAEIAAFTGARSMDPVRVYVGRRAADTPAGRAEVALRELIRQGAFERDVLVVAVPVGTGWMDPGGHDTLEMMHGGDVATVAVQYSYLTSVLSMATHLEYGVDQARALFDAVYDHWTTLPPATRPRLYVHGLSQGAYNMQAALRLLDMLGDPIDGGLFAGSPFLAPGWAQVRQERAPGSPVWYPQFGNGSLARSMTQFEPPAAHDAPWGPIRFVFLNHGSDAIVNFSADSLVRPPAFLTGPRAPDVAPEIQWFPLVTAFQMALDMAVSLRVPGYGHYYIAPDYIDGWAAVAPPDGWTPARAATLKAVFADRPPPF